MRALFTIIIISSCLIFAKAQREVKTFYNNQSKQVQEHYYVSAEDNQSLVGQYQKFLPMENLR